MCFRPAEISMKICPACGKNNPPISKTCAECGAMLADGPAIDEAAMGIATAPTAPAAPASPNAPAAPKAPIQ